MGWKKEQENNAAQRAEFWIETSNSISHICQFDSHGRLSVKVVNDTRPLIHRMVESFLNKFFPSGYPKSVNEGYLTYTQFRALQHCSSAALSVLSTQSLLFAAGLRPTPAQATAVSWILKDGMQHAGKLICSSMGAKMDSEPKSWRILADVLYDFGTGLEIVSPLCPQLFLELAGLGNFAKGMAVVAARATRLPIYSSFAKEGNLSDLFAKGEAISTLFNVVGMGAGIQLASTVCSTMQGKLIIAPLLSAIHIYCVKEEMRAAPVNTLNPQRTAMIVADFLNVRGPSPTYLIQEDEQINCTNLIKYFFLGRDYSVRTPDVEYHSDANQTGRVSSPADLRYRENLLFPDRIIEEAGSVSVGKPFVKVVKSPSKFELLRALFPDEKFLIHRKKKHIDMILEKSASGEDALRGWLVAAFSKEREFVDLSEEEVMKAAYKKMEKIFPSFLAEVKSRGWYTDQFLDGNGSRFAL